MSDPRPALVDTHCHLDAPQFDGDLPQVLTRAQEAGVRRMVLPATDLASSHKVIKMAEQHEQLHAAVGIHPHNAADWSASHRSTLSELAGSPQVVAIGEIGLDFYRNYAARAAQVRAFSDQLDLAAEVGLPVIVHNREASEEVLTALLDWAPNLDGSRMGRAGVLHAFSGDSGLAAEAIAAGFYLGFAGPLTYPKADGLRRMVAELPLGRTLIETDSPYLPPHPHRGQRNEPSYIELIAVQLAQIHKMDINGIGLTTSRNASILFGWEHGNEDSVFL